MRLSDQEIDTLCKTVETTQRGRVALVFARAIEAEVAERCAQLCTTFDVCDPKYIANAIRAAYKEPTNG